MLKTTKSVIMLVNHMSWALNSILHEFMNDQLILYYFIMKYTLTNIINIKTVMSTKVALSAIWYKGILYFLPLWWDLWQCKWGNLTPYLAHVSHPAQDVTLERAVDLLVTTGVQCLWYSTGWSPQYVEVPWRNCVTLVTPL